MYVTFPLLLVNREKRLPIMVGFMTLPLFLAFVVGQLWPVAAQGISPVLYILLWVGYCLLTNWVYKKYVLEAAIVAVGPVDFTVTYASGRVASLALAQLKQYCYRQWKGHHLTLYAATGTLQLRTNSWHAVAANDRQMCALVESLAALPGVTRC
jgi:hypothetical protein